MIDKMKNETRRQEQLIRERIYEELKGSSKELKTVQFTVPCRINADTYLHLAEQGWNLSAEETMFGDGQIVSNVLAMRIRSSAQSMLLEREFHMQREYIIQQLENGNSFYVGELYIENQIFFEDEGYGIEPMMSEEESLEFEGTKVYEFFKVA